MSAVERAVECRTCGATHLPNVACPPIGRWLISGERVTKRAQLAVREETS